MPSATRYDELARAITESYPQLPNRLQGIARFALDNPDAMALSTVAEIAREAGVPPSAVIRFANALGFAGFPDLQRIYRERLVARSATYRERIEQMRRTRRRQGPRAAAARRQRRSASSSGCASTSTRAGCRRAAGSSSAARASTCSRSAARSRSPATSPTAWRSSRSARSCSTRVGGMLRQQVGADRRGRPADRRQLSQLLARGGRGRAICAHAAACRDRHHRPRRSRPLARRRASVTLRSRRRPALPVPLAGRRRCALRRRWSCRSATRRRSATDASAPAKKRANALDSGGRNRIIILNWPADWNDMNPSPSRDVHGGERQPHATEDDR